MNDKQHDFREAHAWLAGYSDGLEGRDSDPADFDKFAEEYDRGYEIGLRHGGYEVAA